MSDTGTTPAGSPPDSDDPPPSSQPPSSAPASSQATPATTDDSSTDDSGTDDSSTGDSGADDSGTDDSGTDDSSTDDSGGGDSDDCAQIPAAAHAVLEGDIKFQVRLPRSVDQAKQMAHKFTLTSDDGSLDQTVAASSAEACDIDGASIITFTGLAEHHLYTLKCDNGYSPVYTLFDAEPYEQMGEDSDDASDPSAADTPDGSGDTAGDSNTTTA